MKKTLLLLTMPFILFGCKNKEVNEFPFDNLVLSYSGLREISSIKFSKNDTVFLQRRFPKPKENFYAVLRSDEKIKLNAFFKTLNLDKFEEYYEQENIADGGNYQFEILNNKKKKLIHIYGGRAPQELYNYITFLYHFERKLKFISTKQIINFGDLSYFASPPAPAILK